MSTKYLFQKSVEMGNLDAVKDIMNEDIGCDYVDMAFSTAARKGHLEMTEYFLQRGICIYTMELALRMASWRGDYDMVKLLLDYGARSEDGAAYKYAQYHGYGNIMSMLHDQRGYVEIP